MVQDKELLIIMVLGGIVALVLIFRGMYNLSFEKIKNVSSYHEGISMLLLGIPLLMTVFLYVLCRLNYLNEFIAENGYVFLCNSFVAVALLTSDVYVLANKKKIENKNILFLAEHGLVFSVICFIGVIIFWVRIADKSTLFLFLK